jgi:hypothetical protein
MTPQEYVNAWVGSGAVVSAERWVADWLVPVLVAAGGVRLFAALIGQRAHKS